MKFSLESSQRDFFRKHKAIELESLLSTSQLAQLQEGIQEALISLYPKNNKWVAPKDIFLKTYDLWRLNEKIKKTVLSHSLVELVYQLIAEKPIRLAFDQLLPALENSRETSEYPSLFKKDSIKKLSAIQEINCLLILCISGEGNAPNFEEGDPFPSKPGNGVYLSADYHIDYNHLYSRKNQNFILIGYAGKYSQYLFIDADPQVHALKRLGYVFGDTLHDSIHPVILR